MCLHASFQIEKTQVNGFSLVWVRKLYMKYDPSENADPHTSQENSFSQVCVCQWILKDDLTENAASSVCVCICTFK